MSFCSISDCSSEGELLHKCSHCHQRHCGLHRLPERHDCIGLEYYSSDSYRKFKQQKYTDPSGSSSRFSSSSTFDSGYTGSPVYPPMSFAQKLFVPMQYDLRVLLSISLAVGTLVFFSGVLFDFIDGFSLRTLLFLPIFIALSYIISLIFIYGRHLLYERSARKMGTSAAYLYTRFQVILSIVFSVIPFFIPLLLLGSYTFSGGTYSPRKVARLVVLNSIFAVFLSMLFYFIHDPLLTSIYTNYQSTGFLSYVSLFFEQASLLVLFAQVFILLPFGLSESGYLFNYNTSWYIITIGTVVLGLILLFFNLSGLLYIIFGFLTIFVLYFYVTYFSN